MSFVVSPVGSLSPSPSPSPSPAPSPSPSPSPAPPPSPAPSPSPGPSPSPAPSPSPPPGALRECITAIDIQLTATGAEDTQLNFTPVTKPSGTIVGYNALFSQPFRVTISYTIVFDPTLTKDALATLDWTETCNIPLYPGQVVDKPFNVAQAQIADAVAFFKPWTSRPHKVGTFQVILNDFPGIRATADINQNVDDVGAGIYTNTIQITGTNPGNCALPKITKTVGVSFKITTANGGSFSIPPTAKPTIK